MHNFSIVIPLHNEEEHLMTSLSLLVSKLKERNAREWELILVENGSTDGTWDKCREVQLSDSSHIKICRVSEASYGKALKEGIRRATKENIIIFNIDFWDVAFLEQSMDLKSDIVVGSKTLISSRDLRPLHRRLTTYVFNSFLRVIYNFPGTDTHGIKKLRTLTVRPIALDCYPLHELYDTQIVLRACKKKLLYTELPVTVREMRPTRYQASRRIFNVVHDLLVIFKYRYL